MSTRSNSASRSRMRVRRDSGSKLDYYYAMVNKTVLKHQNPVTGLLAASSDNEHSWVRDDVYSIMAVWALALAYKKHSDKDYGRAKAYELEQSVVKLMRGLLMSMMLQIKKVEKFKYTLNKNDCLHAKYSSRTRETVVGDDEWGHLQIDATSIYLLMLAEMTASGLQIIFTLDGVSFIQNLVFYIEYAFLIPDYGIWERGDKTNHGLPELNSSSIGMAKAALEAIDELDLFGSRGGASSIIHVMPDTINWCNTILTCLLPRESNSKETDAALLSIISYPAFALDDMELINLTRNQILTKLQGRYGCSRFIRDGYKTAKEDPRRLHYEPYELKVFENIECEWPLFWCYLVIDGIFYNNYEQVDTIAANLEQVLIKDVDGMKLVPEIYSVPAYRVEEEYKAPKTQDRVPLGKLPHLWGQSLYVIGKLLRDNLIAPGELDPLNRRLCIQPKPDLIVQISVLAETEEIQSKMLHNYGISIQTIAEVEPIQIYSAKNLAYIYSFLGKNERLGLSGRPVTDIGYLTTSKLYSLKGQILAFTPSFMDHKSFYLANDLDYTLDLFRTYLAFVEKNWNNLPGRPTVVYVVTNEILQAHEKLNSALIQTIRKLNSGYINGARVQLGNLDDFIKTACLTNLTFLNADNDSVDNEKEVLKYFEKINKSKSESDTNQIKSNVLHGSNESLSSSSKLYAGSKYSNASSSLLTHSNNRLKNLGSIIGIAKRSRSINFAECPIIQNAKRPSFAYIFIDPKKLRENARRRNRNQLPGVQETGDISEAEAKAIMESRANRKDSVLDGAINFTNHADTYGNMNMIELLNMLKETKSLHDEADILHYLYETNGIDWEIPREDDEKPTQLRDLILGAYEKASSRKMWWLVRHSAGMLSMYSSELAKSVLNIIIRQKQISIGMPSNRKNSEISIKSPLPLEEIYQLIKEVCGKDMSMVSVTQELLISLSLFISTEPQLFQGMIRLRLGLIIQVMIGELERTLSCTIDEATDHLFNLSPFEMKTLLHMIISGKELGATSFYSSRPPPKESSTVLLPGTTDLDSTSSTLQSNNTLQVTNEDAESAQHAIEQEKKKSERKYLREELKGYSVRTKPTILLTAPGQSSSSSIKHDDMDDVNQDSSLDKHGQWIRRRRLDGSLNRVPIGFYSKVWMALEKCQGVKIFNSILTQSLTREMTKEELKFALLVEEELNKIPEPEYRQLVVEALMLVVSLAQSEPNIYLNRVIGIDEIVERANQMFLIEQIKFNGDATLCCAIGKRCPGAHNICEHFYDSAPSGRYGTMNYLFKAVIQLLQVQEHPECKIQ